MAIVEEQPYLAPALRGMLSRMRLLIRGYVLFYGLASVLVVAGLAFWASLAVDWLLEPPAEARILLLAIAGCAAAFLFVRMILMRLFVPLTDRSMALLVERKFADFDDSLVTAVELSGTLASGPSNREMLLHTSETAQRRSAGLQLDQMFNPAPLTRSIVTTLVMAVSVVVFASAFPETFGLWYRRCILLAAESWPRHTLLLVEGFDENGTKKVARGGDVSVLVKADTERVVPTSVEIRYWTDDGARGREIFTREGVAIPGEDKYQFFSHTFSGVLSSRGFDVVGGDYRIRNLRIEVVESPSISQVELYCQYPAYTGLAPREITVSGAMRLPEGTRVTVRAVANKDLQRVEIDYPVDEETFTTETLQMDDFEDRTRFEFVIDNLDADKTLFFRLSDTDGITNREPIRLALAALSDLAPQVSLRLEGIGTAITPQARLPLVGTITDDYGVASAWYEYVVDDEESARQSLFQNETESHADAAADRLPVELTIQNDQALEVRDLELTPGQKLLVSVKSTDSYTLGDKPNEGSSERFLVDVVTPDDLRRMLEARELNLRRRFESIIQEVADTRDSLSRIDFLRPDREVPAPAAEDASTTIAETADASATSGGDRPSPSNLELRHLRVESAMQGGRKNAQETLGVAFSFAAIRVELDNNRIDSEELKERIQTGIADPLMHVGQEMFPQFERLLTDLRDRLEDDPAGRAAALVALRQSDAILAEMRRALAKMVELEDLSEVLAMLREIIEAEIEVHRLTKQRQVEKARELLKED